MGPFTISQFERFKARHPLQTGISIAEIGAADVNGSFRPHLERYGRYVGIDLVKDQNVDIVVNETELLCDQIPARFDLVVCCDVLEHTPKPALLFYGMAGLLVNGGYLFCLTPFSWPFHRHPVDCYRYAPDGLTWLARESGLKVEECYIYRSGGWPNILHPVQTMQWLQGHWRNWFKFRTGYNHCCLIAKKP